MISTYIKLSSLLFLLFFSTSVLADTAFIYYKNSDLTPTIFPDQNRHYNGDEGTLVIFPSNTRHYVDKQISKKERIENY